MVSEDVVSPTNTGAESKATFIYCPDETQSDFIEASINTGGSWDSGGFTQNFTNVLSSAGKIVYLAVEHAVHELNASALGSSTDATADVLVDTDLEGSSESASLAYASAELIADMEARGASSAHATAVVDLLVSLSGEGGLALAYARAEALLDLSLEAFTLAQSEGYASVSQAQDLEGRTESNALAYAVLSRTLDLEGVALITTHALGGMPVGVAESVLIEMYIEQLRSLSMVLSQTPTAEVYLDLARSIEANIEQSPAFTLSLERARSFDIER